MSRNAQIPETLPDQLPVLSTAEMVLFPGAIVALQLEGGTARIETEIESAGGLFVVACPEGDGLRPIGALAQVVETGEGEKGKALLVRGLARVQVGELTARDPVFMARVSKLVLPRLATTPAIEALVLEAKRLAREILSMLPAAPGLSAEIDAIDDPGRLADLLAFRAPSPVADKRAMFEELDVEKRLRQVVEVLGKRRQVIQVSSDIDSSVRRQVSRAERDHLLRQRRKAIEHELKLLDGSEEEGDGLDALRKSLKNAKLTPEARALVERELKRLGSIAEASPERGVARNWLQWIADMPWGISTPDTLDVVSARRVLDADHEGLAKVKSRIGQFLAVRALKGDMKGPILCLVGPPGVGKTSLGQSIARAMGRKFVRVSLGGVRDEAEIRGHRRTYVGALPGRIAMALKRAGSSNPVMLLDEVDKLGNSAMGDPSAALLEVLDPEQNNSFTDHYLELPFDLSRVLFIATANTLETVPAPLRDRMEVLELPGYATGEKIAIAREHLWPKQLEAHGLKGAPVAIDDAVLRRVIEGYTREAGVRGLERRLADLCRHLAVERAEALRRETPASDVVTGVVAGAPLAGAEPAAPLATRVLEESDVAELLGPPDFEPELVERVESPGIATGLAWTPVGGALLFIEATEMPGQGKLILTGQLGSVMRESTHAALSYLRAHALDYGLAPDPLAGRDVHVHIPEGATPKDGPSAGVTLFTALVSLLTGIKVRSDVAMTGEATLRGRVLPVGGIKEKVLAAHRAGVKRLILPERCAADLREVPEVVRAELEFVFVKRLEEVLDAALERSPFVTLPRPTVPPVEPGLRAA